MSNDARLTWLGHSTFLIDTCESKRVLIEAFVDSCPTTPAEFHGLSDIDLIVLTHGHADHVADAISIANRSGAVIAGQVELCGWLARQGFDADRLLEFNKGGTIEAHGLRISMVDARHSSSSPDGEYLGEAAGMVFELEDGRRIYHAGDTCVFSSMQLIGRLYSPDLAILPIGGHYTMNPRQAGLAAELLAVNDVLGMHYGTFPPLKGRPEDLRQHVADSVMVHELEPGESLALSKIGSSAVC